MAKWSPLPSTEHLCPYNKSMNNKAMKPSDFPMAQSMTFADLTGRAGRPMDFDGDFDDHFTAEDYDRRRYARDGWGTVPGDRWV